MVWIIGTTKKVAKVKVAFRDFVAEPAMSPVDRFGYFALPRGMSAGISSKRSGQAASPTAVVILSSLKVGRVSC